MVAVWPLLKYPLRWLNNLRKVVPIWAPRLCKSDFASGNLNIILPPRLSRLRHATAQVPCMFKVALDMRVQAWQIWP